jgi:hypothetical protein
MQSGLYITTSRCDYPGTSTENAVDHTISVTTEKSGHVDEREMDESNPGINTSVFDMQYLNQLTENMLVNHIQSDYVEVEVGSSHECLDQDHLGENLQINEEHFTEEIIIGEEPDMSINDVNVVDVAMNIEANMERLEEDNVEEEIIEEDIEIFRINESMEAATLSLSQEGGESQHVPRIDMEFRTDEEAYKFYNDYAMIVGFSVVKSGTYTSRCKETSGEVTRRIYKCQRRGTLEEHVNEMVGKQTPGVQNKQDTKESQGD